VRRSLTDPIEASRHLVLKRRSPLSDRRNAGS
jgi:hypothetical protein